MRKSSIGAVCISLLSAGIAHAGIQTGARPATEQEARAQRLAQQDPSKGGCAFGPGDLPSKTIGRTDAYGKAVPLGGELPIQYIFVLMQENRSFDNYFGRFQAYLKEVRKLQEKDDPRLKAFVDQDRRDGVDVPGTPYHLLDQKGRSEADKNLKVNAHTHEPAPFNPTHAGAGEVLKKEEKHYYMHHAFKAAPFCDPAIAKYSCWPKDTTLCVSDTAHEWWAVHQQWNRGRMDGFYESNNGFFEGGSAQPGVAKKGDKIDARYLDGDRAMFYYDEQDIPFYYWLAEKFAIGDHYFSSALGPTFVNRDFLYGTTSRGLTCNAADNYPDLSGVEAAGSQKAIPAAVTVPKEGFALADPNTRQQIKLSGIPGKVYGASPRPLNTVFDLLNAAGINYTHYYRWRYWGFPLGVPKEGSWYGASALAETQKYTYDAAKTMAGGRGLAAYMKDENDYWVAEIARLKKKFTKPAELKAAIAAVDPTKFSSTMQRRGGIYQVNFLDPDLIEDVNGEDEHPPGVPQMGERWIYDVVKMLMANPEVWKRSVLFITYDEHGGFYDHVTPPPACVPDDSSFAENLKWTGRYGNGSLAYKNLGSEGRCFPLVKGKVKGTCQPKDKDNTDAAYAGGFNRYGVRVPLIVVSPWARHHYVSHYTYDHTSIVRFIEARFNLPALTRRDANADALFDFFDFSQAQEKLAGEVQGWGNEASEWPAKLPSREWSRAPAGAKAPLGKYADEGIAMQYEVTWKAVEKDVATVASYGYTDDGKAASATEKFAMRAPLACQKILPRTAAAGKDIALFPYDSWDWSDGKPPVKAYSADQDVMVDIVKGGRKVKVKKGVAEHNVYR